MARIIRAKPASSLQEASENAVLVIEAIADGEFLQRSGNTVIGNVGGGGGGSGDVVGPASATDNGIVRFNGTTGKLVQAGSNQPSITDNGDIDLVALRTVDGRDVSVDGSTLDTHVADLANPHATSIANIGSGTLAQLNTAISDADLVPDSRTVATTAPLAGGGALSGNLTLSITAATTIAAGSMSAADKTKLDGITAGAAVASVTAGAGMVNNGTATAPILDIVATDASIIVNANDIGLGTTIPSARTFSGAISFTAAGSAVSVTNNVVVGGVISNAAGTAALPSYTVTGDLNTGIYAVGADDLGISTGGTLRWDVSTTAVTSTLPLVVPAGTVSAPGIQRAGDSNTGIYFTGAGDQVAIACNGTQMFVWTDTVVSVVNAPLRVTDGTTGAPGYAFTNEPDCGFYISTTNTIGCATNGASRWTISTTTFGLTTVIALPQGSVGSPCITATGDSNTGFFFGGADELVSTAGGVEKWRVNATGVSFFAVTPVARQTSGANLTNNVTSGGTDDTIADFTATVGTNALGADPTDVNARLASIRNNQYQLARKLKQVNDALRLYGLLT